LARKQNWFGTEERERLLLKRLQRFFSILPKIITFRRDRVRGYLFRSSLIKSYLSSSKVAKLQLGAADNAIDGWLNTSLRPRSSRIVFLDVTQPFPFGPAIFDYVLSEHLIEHLTYNDGRFMLAECFRIIKPGGKIRISTPDLKMLAGLLFEEDGKSKQYVNWIATTFPRDIPAENAAMVINNLFYNWGHRFLYDFLTLKMTLEEIGFIDVRAYEIGMSDDEALRDIELHVGKKAVDEEMSRFEALVVEAVRPQL
jgi:predicted SAM-dependent methyltransferase